MNPIMHTHYFIDQDTGRVLGTLEASDPIYIGCTVVYNGILYEVVNGNVVSVYVKQLQPVIQLKKVK